MVGILVSFWDGLFSGAMLVSGSVYTKGTVRAKTHQTRSSENLSIHKCICDCMEYVIVPRRVVELEHSPQVGGWKKKLFETTNCL